MDLLTLRIVNGTIAVAFMFVMWRLAALGSSHRYFYFWLAAAACLLLNSLIGILLAFLPLPYWAFPLLNNLTIALMHLTLIVGVQRWLQRRSSVYVLGLWLLSYALWTLSPIAQQHTTWRLLGCAVLLSAMAAYSCWLVWQHAPKQLSRTLFMLGFGFACGQYSVRSLVFVGELMNLQSPPLQMLAHHLGWFALTAFSLVMFAATISCFALDKWHELRQLAQTDALTGVLNRHALMPHWQRMLRSITSQRLPLTLAIVDLDHFKALNDRFGHPTGDKVLQWLGQQLKFQFREHDLVVRLGGEEFLLVLPGLDQSTSQQKLEAMCQIIRSHRFHEAPDIQLSASIGALVVSADRLHEAAFEQWLAKADAALYHAKAAGRDQLMYC